MSEPAVIEPEIEEIELPPTEDELPYSDGMPLESHQHVLQMYLLQGPLRLFWQQEGRTQVFTGGNMFVYFSLEQVRNQDFRGPDVFVALDVSPRARKSWVVWQEGKGPDIVIELLSDSTAERDKGIKKQVYQDQLRVPEYFWHHPLQDDFAGFTLRDGVYQPIEPDEQGARTSQLLHLRLIPWHGTYGDVESRWLRWAHPDGTLLPTEEELAAAEKQRADTAEAQARAAEQQIAALQAQLARYRQQFGDLPGPDE